MSGQTYPWIVVTADDYPEHPHCFLCQRCGGHEQYPLPIDLEVFCAWGKIFERRHRGCKVNDEHL